MVPPFGGDSRAAENAFTQHMERDTDLVDYLVGVMFLAIILIVVLALLGNQLANVLHQS